MPQSTEVRDAIDRKLMDFYQAGLSLVKDDNVINVSEDGSYLETIDFDSPSYPPIERDGKTITRHVKTVFTRSQFVLEYEQAPTGEPIPIDQTAPVA